MNSCIQIRKISCVKKTMTIKIVTVPIDADNIRVLISLRGVVVTVEEI